MVMFADDFGGRPGLRDLLAHRGVRRWLLGAAVALGWLVTVGVTLYGRHPGVVDRVAGTSLIALFGVAFLVATPLSSALPHRMRVLGPIALLALSFALFPWIGFGVAGLWTYVGVTAAMTIARMRWVIAFVATLGTLCAWFEYLDDRHGADLYVLPLVVVSASLMMAAFGRQIVTMLRLRATRHELARLAVEQERNRFARDLHDILGHSLTVIAIKAELAGRLIDTDPKAAKGEIAELEGLARGALADVRSTVGGFRGVSVATELATARSALESAGIHATLPGAVDVVPADSRELFGWVVREGITNVVRHSGARNASIALTSDSVEVVDDGIGPCSGGVDGNGLAGLRERVEAAGGRMSVGTVETGGFRLEVTVAR